MNLCGKGLPYPKYDHARQGATSASNTEFRCGFRPVDLRGPGQALPPVVLGRDWSRPSSSAHWTRTLTALLRASRTHNP